MLPRDSYKLNRNIFNKTRIKIHVLKFLLLGLGSHLQRERKGLGRDLTGGALIETSGKIIFNFNFDRLYVY